MGISEELKIVISGDPKKFDAAMDKALESTKRLEAGLSAAAKISGAAFAALTGTVVGLTAAYRDQEIQEQKTTALLERTGNVAGATANDVFELASSLQQVSIYGDEVILSAQNILIGLAKLDKDGLKKASQATLDLASFMGTDLNTAALQLGKALSSPAEGLSALGRSGIKFTQEQQATIKALDEGGQKAQAQAMILDTLNQRYGGLALAATNGTGKIIQLENAISDVGEELGRAFTPALSKAAEAMIPFFKYVAESPQLIRTAAAVIGIATALTGLATAFAVGTLAFIKWNAIVKAAELSNLALSLSFKTLIGATGIGLVVVAIADLAVNWDRRVIQMNAAWTAFTETVSKGAAAIGEILSGLQNGQLGSISSGFDKLVDAGGSFYARYSSLVDEGNAELESKEAKHQENKATIQAEGNARALASQAAYLEEKKALDDEYKKLQAEADLSESQRVVLQDQETKNKLLQAQLDYKKAESEAKTSDKDIELQQEQEYQTELLRIKNEGREFDLNADREIALTKAKEAEENRQKFVIDEKKYGTNLAKVKQVYRSEEYAATKTALGQLATLTQSSNRELFEIGKVAAIAQATINIAEGITKAIAQGGFLGLFMGAAVAAAGAVQIASITSTKMAQGGLVEGGIPGVDSVPLTAQRGELVAPRKNFDEVVNAVADQRNGQAGGAMHITIGFTDDAFRIIERKLVERRTLGIT